MYPLIVIRYADDTIVVVVMGFQRYHETRAFLDDLKERMRKFELALHPDKTRLIHFGRQEFAVHGMGSLRSIW
jgi:RNA-directed DNA polymerase